MEHGEMAVVFRYGYALLTVNEGRTAVCTADTGSHFLNFSVVSWCDTYQEALMRAADLDDNGWNGGAWNGAAPMVEAAS
jgi:hypothetical protein